MISTNRLPEGIYIYIHICIYIYIYIYIYICIYRRCFRGDVKIQVVATATFCGCLQIVPIFLKNV